MLEKIVFFLHNGVWKLTGITGINLLGDWNLSECVDFIQFLSKDDD